MRVGAALLAVLLASCTGGSDKAEGGPAALVGRRAPTFTTTDLDGKQVRLADFRGETVVVNFWASWCTPCRREFPILAELDKRDDVAVVGVVFNDTADNAREFMQEHAATWPALKDDGKIAKAYRVGPGIPATIVVGPNGIVTVRHIGEFSSPDELI